MTIPISNLLQIAVQGNVLRNLITASTQKKLKWLHVNSGNHENPTKKSINIIQVLDCMLGCLDALMLGGRQLLELGNQIVYKDCKKMIFLSQKQK
jgi:hypothetical protein